MTIQIAVKLPDELVHAIDGLVERGAFPNRSQAVRMGLEAMVAASGRQEAERLYRDAVARVPETEAELDEATRLAIEAIHDEPWERWW